MKLLLDENISDRIVQGIADLFAGSTHVKSVALKEASNRSADLESNRYYPEIF